MCRSGRSSLRAGEMVEGLRNLDDGYIPPIFVEQGGRRPARPQDDRRTPRLDPVDAASRVTWVSSPASPRAPPLPAPSSAPPRSSRHHRLHVLPTAAGSTSPPEPGPTSSTTSSSGRSRSSTSDGLLWLPATGYPAGGGRLCRHDDSSLKRHDGRALDELRPCVFVRDFTEFAAGSVLAVYGRTKVLCTASVDEDVPAGCGAPGAAG